MGFWIFMLIMSLVTPLLMIGFGRQFQDHPPKEINSIYGYRTKMSMKNMETWTFAHQYFGRRWILYGKWILLVSIAAMMFLIGKNENIIGIAGSLLMLIQCLVLILPIISTEKELRKRFDSEGKPCAIREKDKRDIMLFL